MARIGTNMGNKVYHLLINEDPLPIMPLLAEVVGLNEAVVLQQVHFWVEYGKANNDRHKYHDGHWWTYGTYTYWKNKNFRWWAEKTVYRIFRSLEEKGLLVSGNYNRMWSDQTKWYRINYELLEQLIEEFQQRVPNLDEPPPPEEEAYDQNDQIDNAKLSKSDESDSRSGQHDQMGTSQAVQVRNGQLDQLLPDISAEISTEISSYPAASGGNGRGISPNESLKEKVSVNPTHTHKEDSLDLEYLEPGQEFGESSLKNPPKWKIPPSPLCERVFGIVGRKYFKSRDERTRWLNIEKAITPLDRQGRTRYPREWIDAMLEWVKRKNDGGGHSIDFVRFLNLIENEDRKNEWVANALHNPEKYGVFKGISDFSTEPQDYPEYNPFLEDPATNPNWKPSYDPNTYWGKVSKFLETQAGAGEYAKYIEPCQQDRYDPDTQTLYVITNGENSYHWMETNVKRLAEGQLRGLLNEPNVRIVFLRAPS